MTDPQSPRDDEPSPAEVDGPRERRGFLTRWGRRRVALAVAAVVVVATAATVVVTTVSGDDRPVPAGVMPTLGSQFASPPGSAPAAGPARPAALPRYPGAPLWTVTLPGEPTGVPDLAVTDHGYVLQSRTDVLGLDRSGKEVWRFTPPEVDLFTVQVTGRRVFVGYANPEEDRWPQPDVVVALDAATGAELWRETEASFWSVTTDTVHFSVCRGGQNDRVGDCTVSARDPGTNRVRWAVPAYASAGVVGATHRMQALPTPPYLLIGAYPTGADSFVVTGHDPATGAVLGRYAGADGRTARSVADATATTVTTTADHDENPADGCRATLVGYAVRGGRETWRHTARTMKDADGARCTGVPASRNRGRQGITTADGAPGVLNLDTGAVEWSAPATGTAVAATDTTLLVVEQAADAPATLVAYRVGDATPVWRAPFHGVVDTSTVTITATAVVVTGQEGDAARYDLGTGDGWSYGGVAVRETPTWFAVCDEGSCRGYPVS